MAPRKQHVAVLSCDPSWRGLAFILYIPSLGVKQSFLFDLKDYDKSKAYKHPSRTLKSIQGMYDTMFLMEPRMNLVDKLIMESQYKTNMQVLSWLLVANLLPRTEVTEVEYISPLTCKRNFNIELTGTHHGNKKAATSFVEKAKVDLAASETVFDHNTADACLLLNTYLQTTKNIIHNNINDWSMSVTIVAAQKGGPEGTTFICPMCKNESGKLRKAGPTSKMNGKYFLNCWWKNNMGKENEEPCKAFQLIGYKIPTVLPGGYVDDKKKWKIAGYDDGQDELPQDEPVGQKRYAQSNKGPERKQQKTTNQQTTGEKQITQRQVIDLTQKAVSAVKENQDLSTQKLYAYLQNIETKLHAVAHTMKMTLELLKEEKRETGKKEVIECEDGLEDTNSQESPQCSQANQEIKLISQEELDEIDTITF